MAVEDEIFRAIGTLKYARNLSEVEAFDCLSRLRVGLDLGLYKGLNFSQMNDLIKLIQKYTVLDHKYIEKSPQEEDVIRAQHMRRFIDKEEIIE